MEKKIKLTGIWLLVFNAAVVLAYGAVLFFTNLELIQFTQTKIAVSLAAFNIILYFVLNKIFESRPQKFLETYVFFTALIFIFLVDYFGGPTGILFPILYILILVAFIYKKMWGYITFGVVFSYQIFHIGISGADLSTNLIEHLTPLISTFIAAAGGVLLGDWVRGIISKNESLSNVANKLSAEKSTDEAVLTAIADGVYAVDMNRNLVLFNKAAQEMTGWSEKDALGLSCKNVMKLKKDDNLSVCEKDCPALAVWNTEKSVFRNDTCFTHRSSKKKIQLSTSYAPIKDMSGKKVGAICVFRDITKDRELERQRNEFVSTASHELRTPITATEGYISIVTDSGTCKTDQKSKEYLAKAKHTLLGMSRLVQNLLSVTKIEEGKLETNITNFSIRDLTKEVVDVFARKAKEKKIKLDLVESKKLSSKGKKVIGRSLNVRADREMIREVLNNLVENAVKFTEKGGVTVSIDYDEEFATVNVEDTGMGMPKDAQKHLFEKFYRVDNTATREVGGTGLGLYITRSIVEMFGGNIAVETTKGKGSKFHFTIPLSLD